MSKHTQGPWYWTDDENQPEDQYGDKSWLASESTFEMVLDYNGCGSHECSVKTDDKRLIAAAPDLLEALQEMVALLELVMPFDGPQQRKARAAIAKATGQPESIT